MKRIIILFALVNFIPGLLISQSDYSDIESKMAVSKLSFIAGKWEGHGWMYGQDGQRHEFDQSEKVQFKLDSTILLIQGRGNSDGKIIHDALAIISFNKEDGNYSFQSYLANGRRGSFRAELKDEKLYWYPAENIRYIIYINKEEQWFEIGEMNRNGNWFQFFEMTLDKK